VTYTESPAPSFLFDLDGTLIDSVYQHVIAWRAALAGMGIDLSVWRIHRRIGMSGGLFVSALLRETGLSLSPEEIERLQRAHADEYRAQMDSVLPLPGASALLNALTERGVRWAIATSGNAATARPALKLLGLPESTSMVTRDLVRHAKPDPDLFLAAAALLGVDARYTMVVGDSVWDLLAARRAGALGVGLLSGGYGREELERAGAFRVYSDPADLLARLDELGVRSYDGFGQGLRGPGPWLRRRGVTRPGGYGARGSAGCGRAPGSGLPPFPARGPRPILNRKPARWEKSLRTVSARPGREVRWDQVPVREQETVCRVRGTAGLRGRARFPGQPSGAALRGERGPEPGRAADSGHHLGSAGW